MIVSLFRKSQWYTPIFLVILGLLLWVDAFWHLDRWASFSDYSSGPFYHFLIPTLEANPYIALSLSFTLLMIQVFYINHIATSKEFIDRFSALPALVYLLLMSSHPQLITPHPLLFANGFLLIALNKTFKANQEHLVMPEVYNVGLLTALAALFYFPSVVILLLLILSLFVYYLISLRAILAAVFGLITPIVFLGIYYFLTGDLETRLTEATIYFEPMNIFRQTPGTLELVFVLTAGLLAFLSFSRLLLMYMPDRPIRIRKRIMVLFISFIVSLLSYVVATDYLHIHYGLLVIPLSIALSFFLHDLGRKKITGFIFVVFVLVVLASRFSGYFIF